MYKRASNQFLFFFYFAVSTLLTWWFVTVSQLYISEEQMMLSTIVAGGKWAIQVIAAVLLLGNKTWIFLKNIGFVCFVGSCILVPYILLRKLGVADSAALFTGSLIISVLAMIISYYRAARQSGVSINWFFGWLACLAIAITLQLTVVFGVI